MKRRVPLRFGVAENHAKMALPVDRTLDRIYNGLLSTPKTGWETLLHTTYLVIR